MKTMNLLQEAQSVKSDNLIPVEEFCSIRNIELSFIHELQKSNLIEITICNNKGYFMDGQLDKLAKIVRFHYELEIS